jgi:hypothetical protein
LSGAKIEHPQDGPKGKMQERILLMSAEKYEQ